MARFPLTIAGSSSARALDLPSKNVVGPLLGTQFSEFDSLGGRCERKDGKDGWRDGVSTQRKSFSAFRRSLSLLYFHRRPLVRRNSDVKDKALSSISTWCLLLCFSIASTATSRETIRSLIVRLSSADGPISRIAIITLDATFGLSPVPYGVEEIRRRNI
jgi:hypothetical protein